MKNYLIIIMAVIFFICQKIPAQEYYYVISWKGRVTVNNKSVKVRDKINENDIIKFSSPNDELNVLHTTKGNISLTPKGGNASESELITYLKGKFVPEISTISSRSIELLQKSDDFYQYFENIGYLVLPYNEFHVDTLFYPLTGNSFFFIRYEYHNEVINKKLPYNGNSVIIKPEELFKVDGKAIMVPETSKPQIFYFNGKEKKSFLLSNLVVNIADENKLKQEIETISGIIQDSQKVRLFIFQYLNLQYGNFDEEAIEKITGRKN